MATPVDKSGWGLHSISYDTVDINAYLDLSNKRLTVDKMVDMLEDIADDALIKHLSISNNISAEETEQPSRIMKFFDGVRYCLSRNRTLTALDVSGNHLFDNTPHPTNEHIINYLEALSDILCKSRIKYLDISDNNAIGRTGRQHKGLHKLINDFVLKKGAKAFTCRFSRLHSQSFALVADGLGIKSKLTYLDLSDNIGGLGSFNESNYAGIACLCTHLPQTLHLRVLKLARNRLVDECFQLIGHAVGSMPRLQFLDLSGNLCGVLGAEAIKEAMLSLTPFAGTSKSNKEGLKELDLSHNPLGEDGMCVLCDAIAKTDTLTVLNVGDCDLGNQAAMLLEVAMGKNCTILDLGSAGNPCSEVVDARCQGQAAANRCLLTLRKNADAIDADKLPKGIYSALAEKLHFLPEGVLSLLHNSESFNKPFSEMQTALHMLVPPGRRTLFSKVVMRDATMTERLQVVRKIDRVQVAARKIFLVVLHWYRGVQAVNRIKAAMREARRREEEANRRVQEGEEKYNF